MTDKQGLRERFQREMDLDESACRICSLIAEEQELPDPEHSCLDHMHYHARTLEKSADECYKASLELIFAHIADIHMVILKILSARYGHSIADMLKTVMNHDEYKNIYLHPVLKSLVYFDPLDEGTTLWKKRLEETHEPVTHNPCKQDLSEKKVNIIEAPKQKKSKPATVSRKKTAPESVPTPSESVPTPSESVPTPSELELTHEPKKSKPAIVRKKAIAAVESEPEPKKSKPATIRKKVKE